jgi:putative flippase GtrA
MEGFNRLFKSEFARFVLVGGISAVLEYSLYFLFKSALDYLVANVLAFGLTNIVTFILSRRFVFAPSGNKRSQEAALFFGCLIGALLVNQVVLWALVEFVSVDDKIAKALAIVVTVIWNFFTRKHLVFRNREVATQEAPTEFRSDKP